MHLLHSTAVQRLGRMLLIAGLSAAAISSAQAHNGAIAIAYPVEGITIDGDLTDWPAGMKVYHATHADCGAQPSDENDLSCQFRVGYNVQENALYIAADVADQSPVIDANPDDHWNNQDGCTVYLDRRLLKNGLLVEQYFQYGSVLRAHGFNADKENAELQVANHGGRRVYEWRIRMTDTFRPGATLGFDLDVTDKDQDGSFTWMAWGRGKQKVHYPSRIGDLYLMPEGEEIQFGQIAGQVRMQDAAQERQGQFPSVSIQSTTTPQLWALVNCDSAGKYTANLPVGSYTVSPVSSANQRVVETDRVSIQLEADQETTADTLVVSKLPAPDLIGTEGVLQSKNVDRADIDSFVRAYRDYYKIPGLSLAIIADGQVAYQRSYGLTNALTKQPVGHDTVFEACSLTKPIFAFAVNRLIERGVLDLHTPLHQYLPNAPGYEDVADDARFKRITTQHVLAHRTGFPNWRNDKLAIYFEPGTKHGYSGEGMELLGAVVAHVTGKNLAEVIQDEVFEPLDIENAYLTWNDTLAARTATGHINGGSPIEKSKTINPAMAYSLHINAANYAKLLTAILRREGLSEATYNEMLRQQFPTTDSPCCGEFPYGLGLVVEETPLGTKYSHGGVNPGWRCRFAILDELKIGFVVFTNNEQGMDFANDLEQYLLTGRTLQSEE